MKLHRSFLLLIICTAISFIILTFVGGYSYWYFSKSNDAQKWVTHTHEIISILEAAEGNIINAENNQRAFLITNNESFLQDYEKDISEIRNELTSLEEKLSDNKPQRGNLKILEDLIDTRIDSLKYGYQKMRENPQEAYLFVKSGVGARQMKAVKSHLETMRDIEVKLLNKRLKQADLQSQRTANLILASILIAFITTGTFALFNVRDLKRRFKTENSLRKAEHEAQAANKAKSDFLANMSHEIRTPMNAIVGMADLLMETSLTSEQKRYVQIFQRSGHGLLGLINDILDLSKVEAGQLELECVDFGISEVLDQVSELVAIKAHQKGIEFIVLIDPDINEYYVGDANRIRQVILNLVNNSVKFTERGEVMVSINKHPLGDAPNHLLIQIQDSGMGMTPEQAKKVFERFAQANENISSKFGGTGLGLSISKKLIELMNGSIKIESKLGVGTTLSIDLTLPISNKPIISSSYPSADFKNKRALIVDDNANNRLILRQILSKHEVIIEEAVTGREAIEKMTSAQMSHIPFDFILMDGKLPDTDGFTATEKLKQAGLVGDTIIMMLTSDQRAGDIQRSKDLGIKGYLVKPISPRELSNKLQMALGNKIDQKEQTIITNQNTHQQNILVVDDNPDNRSLIEAYFKGTKFRSTMAADGMEAVNAFKNNKFDLILMDIQMPVMDGLEATREIRKIEKDGGLTSTPIIALSAYALKEEKDKSIQAGCNQHLSKPIKKAELLTAISNYMVPKDNEEEFFAEVDPDLKEMAINYIAARKEEMSVLKQNLMDKDFKNLTSLGHKMRGVAESYGFPELTQYGDELEKASKLSRETECAEIIRKIEHYLKYVKIINCLT